MLNRIKRRLSDMTRDPGRTLKTAAIVTLAGVVTREAVEIGWRLANGERPPHDPTLPDVKWSTALAWTTAVGVGVGLARLAARRALHPNRPITERR